MIWALRTLWGLLDAEARRKVWVLFGFLGLGAVLESAGVALFVPLILLVADSESAALPFVQPFFDFFELTSVKNQMIALAAALVVFYAVKNAVLGFVVWMQARIPQETLAALSERLMRVYLDRRYERHLMQNSAEIVRNLTGSLALVTENGLRGSFSLVMESVLAAAALAVVFMIEPAGAVIIAAVLGAAMLSVVIFVRRRVTHWGEQLQILQARQIKHINESTDGFREIKLTGTSAPRTEKIRRLVEDAAPFRVKMTAAGYAPRLAGEFAVILAAFAVIVYLTVIADKAPEQMIAAFGVFAAAAMRVLPSVSRVVEALTNLKHCSAVLAVIAKDLDDETETPESDARPRPTTAAPEAAAPVLAVENARYAYPGAGTEALLGVSLNVPAGSMVCVAGASGAGKSTLIDIILGLIEPSSGAVTADGCGIRKNIEGWRRRIGYVPQNIVIADESLRDNILFGREKTPESDARIAEVCRMVRLDELLDEKRGGLDARLGERGAWLSGGQRQRAGLARALYGRPSLLVLDEPVSAVDNRTAAEITAQLAELKKTCSIIIIAHSLDVIRQCERTVFMGGGKILADGPYDELVRTVPAFRAFTAGLGAGEAA